MVRRVEHAESARPPRTGTSSATVPYSTTKCRQRDTDRRQQQHRPFQRQRQQCDYARGGGKL